MKGVVILLEADTTGIQYKIGYQIGSWLPFILIAAVALAIILKGFRHKGE